MGDTSDVECKSNVLRKNMTTYYLSRNVLQNNMHFRRHLMSLLIYPSNAICKQYNYNLVVDGLCS